MLDRILRAAVPRERAWARAPEWRSNGATRTHQGRSSHVGACVQAVRAPGILVEALRGRRDGVALLTLTTVDPPGSERRPDGYEVSEVGADGRRGRGAPPEDRDGGRRRLSRVREP